MTEQADRVAEFRADVARMGLRDPVTRREQALLRLGALGLVVGPIISIAAYFLSHNTTNQLQQRDAIVVALIGVSLAVAGGVLFLRYSFGRLLRFWLARFVFEQHERGQPPAPVQQPEQTIEATPSTTADAEREPGRPLKAR